MNESNYEPVSLVDGICDSCKYRAKYKYEEPCALCIQYDIKPNYIKTSENCFSCKHYKIVYFHSDEPKCCLSCSLRHTKRDCSTCDNSILEGDEEPCCSCKRTSMGRSEYEPIPNLDDDWEGIPDDTWTDDIEE